MTAEPQAPPPIELFYSYSHEDEPLRKELEKHLSSLQQQGFIAGWHDRLISAGTEWERQTSSRSDTGRLIKTSRERRISV